MARKDKHHYPDLDREVQPTVCVSDGEEWPCRLVRDVWDIPAHLTDEEARQYLVHQLDGVA